MKARRIGKLLSVAALSAGLVFAGSSSASATNLYLDENWRGAVYGADNQMNLKNVGFNDKASSLRHYGYSVAIYTDINYGGQGLRSNHDYNSLKAIPLFLGGNWNDKISSYRR